MAKISDKGLSLIKHFEGCRLEPYRDPVGNWTIGYGHIGPTAEAGKKIAKRTADKLLRADVTESEGAVGRLIEVDLEQHEFDALVSFTFNVGQGNLHRSTLRRRLNAGDREAAANELLRWNKGRIGGVPTTLPGLTRRRRAERTLFATGHV
ncbi:MAG: lysozyme, partial [Pseudomonadota bacterium]